MKTRMSNDFMLQFKEERGMNKSGLGVSLNRDKQDVRIR
jgi:hypothetical protein